jgi:NhaA family Na+:H+ antiporter
MDPTPSPIVRSRLAPLFRPVLAFLSAEAAGGVILILCAIAALCWANSPWGDAYQRFWHTELSISLAGRTHAWSLQHWINDGPMVIFFLLVGLEIKRELLFGELASVRQATLPIVTAIGGMAVPALIYAGFNAHGPGAPGWGIPMATDIAFAVGVLALVGRAVPMSLKVLLLAIAIVDDLGAVLVIALFYTSGISMGALALAGAFLVVLVGLNLLRVHQPWPYLLIGIGLWAAILASGIHATIAGVLLAFTIPATRSIEERPYAEYVRGMLSRFERGTLLAPDRISEDQSHALKAMEEASQAVQTPLARIEHALLRPVNFLIVPLFALANAGVDLRGGEESIIGGAPMWGVFVGLLVGKPLGILLATYLACKTRLASLPEGTTLRPMIGIALLCGIGFTMSLFVANLAFPGQESQLAAAKVGILAASLVSGIAGGIVLGWPRAGHCGSGD